MSRFCLKNYQRFRQPISQGRPSVGHHFSASLILGSLFLAALGTYLWQANSLVAVGYQMNDLRQAVNELQEKNEALNIEYVNLQSMQNLEAKIKELKMVSVSQAAYLASQETALAK